MVDEVGADEPTWRAGDRVVVHPGVTCGRCEFCLRGEDVLCTSMRLLGEHRDGAFAEFVTVAGAQRVRAAQGLRRRAGGPPWASTTSPPGACCSRRRNCGRTRRCWCSASGGGRVAGRPATGQGGGCARHRHLARRGQARAGAAARRRRRGERRDAGHREDGARPDWRGGGVDVVFENVGAAVWRRGAEEPWCGVAGRSSPAVRPRGDQPGGGHPPHVHTAS